MLDLIPTPPALMLVSVEMTTQTERSPLAPAARAADPNGGLNDAACGSVLAPAASAERQLPLQTLMEPLTMC